MAYLVLLLLCSLTIVISPARGQATAAVIRPAAANPPSAQAASLYQQGLDLWKQGRTAEAQQRVASAAALAPADLTIAATLGRLDDLVGKYDEAIALFRAVAAKSPTSQSAQRDLAIALAQKGSLEEALPVATEAVRLNPASAEVQRLHAKVLADLHRNGEAITGYLAAERLAPSDPLTQYDLALLYESMNDNPHQLVHLQRLVELQPASAQYRFQLGQSLQRAGDAPGAIAQWRESIRLQPQYRAAIYALSRALRRSSPQEAHTLELRFQQIRLSEETLNTIRDRGNQGVAAMATHDWAAAIGFFQTALELCAECQLEGDLQKDLGLAQCQRGDLQTGIETLQTALALKPNDAEIVQALQIAQKQRDTTH